MSTSAQSDLLITYAGEQTVIMLIDASGSTGGRFLMDTIFNKQRDIIKSLGFKNQYLMFWSSKGFSDNTGVYIFPQLVRHADLDAKFQYVNSTFSKQCTSPHLAFNNIPKSWICPNGITKIFYVTDGDVDYPSELASSIKAVFGKWTNIQLNILTAEGSDRDYNKVETMNSAAGSAVYKIIMGQNMTSYVTKFVSYCPNIPNGFVHINKNKPPAGFIPFKESYFSELRTGEFTVYVKDLIESNKTNEDELLRIVQYLAATVAALINDKPTRYIDGITRTFSNMFEGTALDTCFAHFILSGAIEKEKSGRAEVFANYRSQLTNLYQQAGEMLTNNVSKAIGIENSFLTLPYVNAIVCGDASMIDGDMKSNGKPYPQSCVTVDGILIPVVPFDYNKDYSAINEQCLRQWTRQIINKQYNVDVMGDEVIHIVLSIILRAVVSDIPDSVKDSYRKLGMAMLRKKRYNSNVTELSKLEEGELPIPNNGNAETLKGYLTNINTRLGLTVDPMTVWYAMCLALGNTEMINRQLVHCKQYIAIDFPQCQPSDLLNEIGNKITPVTYHSVTKSNLDYTCPITNVDCSSTGGFKINTHASLCGTNCTPDFVLSEEGRKQLMTVSICPLCYNNLTESNISSVEPYAAPTTGPIFPTGTDNLFSRDVITKSSNSSSNNKSKNSNSNNRKAAAASKSYIDNTIPSSGNNFLIIMKGTVGAGKTTFAGKLKAQIEAKDGSCIATGTDKYCKQGCAAYEAGSKVTQELNGINYFDKSKPGVVIIDTCGENVNASKIFGHNFTKWNIITIRPNFIETEMEGYLSWSLRNVLLRSSPGASDRFYLNPVNAGVATCITVHKKKAASHWNKKVCNLPVSGSMSSSQAIDELNDKADKYQQMLDADMPIDAEVDKIVAKIFP